MIFIHFLSFKNYFILTTNIIHFHFYYYKIDRLPNFNYKNLIFNTFDFNQVIITIIIYVIIIMYLFVANFTIINYCYSSLTSLMINYLLIIIIIKVIFISENSLLSIFFPFPFYDYPKFFKFLDQQSVLYLSDLSKLNYQEHLYPFLHQQFKQKFRIITNHFDIIH